MKHSRRTILVNGLYALSGACVVAAVAKAAVPPARPVLSGEEPPVIIDLDELIVDRPPETVKPIKRTRRVLRAVKVESFWNEVSTYTPDCDGGNPHRVTAANRWKNVRGYPAEYCTLWGVIQKQRPICALPWKHRKWHLALMDYDGGLRFHKYRVRFPWYDPPGHYRYPVDRVPYRNKHGNLLPQRDRYDMFMFMPRVQARAHAHPAMPVEIYEMRYIEEEIV